MTETFTADQAAPLAVVERSGFIESRHVGSAVVLAPDGAVIRAIGAPQAPVFPRSSIKPVLAAVSIAHGADVRGEAAGLATSSHAGTESHVAVVHRMLADGGFSEDDLLCPPAWPLSEDARSAWQGSGGTKSRVRHNCSGKHAAMLLACRAQGWSTHDYTSPDHPLQRAMQAQVEAVGGSPVAAVGVDGCGVPTLAIPLEALARAIQWAATAREDSPDAAARGAARAVNAVRQTPWTVDGSGRENTVLVEETGAFAKYGAEGLVVVVAPSGHTAAVKMLDGSTRAVFLTGMRLLEQIGALEPERVSAAVARMDSLRVLGGGVPVGEIRALV